VKAFTKLREVGLPWYVDGKSKRVLDSCQTQIKAIWFNWTEINPASDIAAQSGVQQRISFHNEPVAKASQNDFASIYMFDVQ